MAQSKTTRKTLKQLIEKQRPDTLWNHFINFISWDYSFQGVDLGNEIRLWQQNFWNRPFYPIHTFVATEDGDFIYANSNLNNDGKVIHIMLWFIPAVLLWNTLTEQFPFKAKIVHTALILVFVFSFLLVSRRFYKNELDYQLEDIYEVLGINPAFKNAKNEWSFGKIIFRLFTYPLSIFLIAISLIVAIPEGEYLYSTITLIVCFTYLISDLWMVTKKSRS